MTLKKRRKRKFFKTEKKETVQCCLSPLCLTPQKGLEMLAAMADALNKTDDASALATEATRLRDVYNQLYFRYVIARRNKEEMKNTKK